MNTDKQRQDVYWKKTKELSNIYKKTEEKKCTPNIRRKHMKDRVSFSIERKEHETLDRIGKFLGLKEKRPAHKALIILIDKFIEDNQKEFTEFTNLQNKLKELTNKINKKYK